MRVSITKAVFFIIMGHTDRIWGKWTSSVKGAMTGKVYNASTRCHKIMHEALQKIRFQTFLETLTDDTWANILEHLSMLKDMFPEQQFEELIKASGFGNVATEYDNFIEMQKATCPTFALWSSYIEVYSWYPYEIQNKHVFAITFTYRFDCLFSSL